MLMSNIKCQESAKIPKSSPCKPHDFMSHAFQPWSTEQIAKNVFTGLPPSSLPFPPSYICLPLITISALFIHQ